MFKGMIEAVLEKIREDLGYIRQHCKYCDNSPIPKWNGDGRRAAVVSGSWCGSTSRSPGAVVRDQVLWMRVVIARVEESAMGHALRK